MSAGLPQQIDARRFAESGRHLKGEILLADCPRLEQAVEASEGPISVDLVFELQSGGRPVVQGRIQAKVILECQRCLEPATIALNCEVSIGVVLNEEQAELLPADLDPLIVEDELKLYELIEDELILALPIVPVHDQCDLPAGALPEEDQAMESTKRENPFAILASLKKDK